LRHAPGYAAAVTTSYVAILAWTIASLLLPRRSDRPAAGERGVANGALVALVCAALVASLVASLAIAHGAALRGTHRIAAGVPILVLADVGTGDPATSNAMQALALVESLLLFGLYRALAGRRPGRTAPLVVGAASLALLGISLLSPVANSTDIYGYVGFALQPATAYAPANVPFGGDHAAIDAMFGTPRPAAWYGPLWIAASHAVVAPVAGLAAQLVALRALEAVALVACLAVFARTGMPFATLALAAVNPALFSLWIVDAHNDLLAVAFIVGAAACARFPAVRVALVAAAGLVKLPLALVGAVAFVDERSPLRRFGFAAAAVALCLGLSYAFGGPLYMRNLFAMSGHFGTAVERGLHALDVLVALGALALALAARRFGLGAAWSSSALSAFVAPWYGVWALPYAAAGGFAALFLIAEPAAAYLFSWNYVSTPFATACAAVAVVGPIVYALLARSRAGRRPPAVSGAREAAA